MQSKEGLGGFICSMWVLVGKSKLGREVEDWVFMRTRGWQSLSESKGRHHIAGHGGQGAASATWLVPQSTQGAIQQFRYL
jgi:hypothetical protein